MGGGILAGRCLLAGENKQMKIRPFKTSEKKPQAEPALDQRQIVQAALGLLDEVGFDGLTMRNLAKKLGIKAASLYWHVRSKQDLLLLLADEICAPMREPDRTLSWRDQLEFLAHESRRGLLAHRDGARVLANSGGPSGPNRLRITEIGLKTLLDAGFDHKDAAYAAFLMNDYVTTFVLEETRYAFTEVESAEEYDFSGLPDWTEALSPDKYPSMAALVGYLTEPDADGRFQFGIEILQDGLEARLAKRKA